MEYAPSPGPTEAPAPRIRSVIRAARPEPADAPAPTFRSRRPGGSAEGVASSTGSPDAPRIRSVIRAARPEPSGSPTETPSRGEALLNRMGHVLENTKPFGKSVADFALHGAITRGLGWGSRELVKGVVSWSGVAGAVGGGVMGTMVTGAFVGAISGALVEYARQVSGNLDRKAETDPSIAGRKAAFLLKFKGLRDKETLKPTDLKRIRNAAIFGAIAGTGAGALMEHTAIGGLIRERIEDFGEFVGGAAQGVGNLAGGAKDLAGGVAGGALGGAGELAGNIPGVRGIGDIAGGIGGALGETAGAAGRTAGDILGGAGELTDKIPGVTGVKETIGNILGLGGVHETGQAAAEGVGQGAAPDAGQVVPPPDVGQGAAQAAAEGVGSVAPDAVPAPDADNSPDQEAGTEPLSPTIVHGHEISGSVIDNSLTFDGKPWVLLQNGVKNIGHVFEAVGTTGAPIDQQALATKLQEATGLWANGQLSPSTNPDLYRLFHLSNGSTDIYNGLLNKATFASLQNLGIVGK